MSKKTKRLIVLDAHAIIHRAYHALPDFSSSRGEPTGALYGISSMIFSIIKEFKPDYIMAAFDLPKPTYRHEAYEDYKSGRKKADENLVKQIIKSRDIFKSFNIPIYEKEGFEADDVIGTICENFKKEKDLEIIIASGDMDTLQLAKKKKIQIYTFKKGIKDTIVYDEEAVKQRFGFEPVQLIDYKGLRGDASDNIIGVPGIGEKTATNLIKNFGTIENIYKTIKKDENKLKEAGIKERIIGILKENEEEAKFSKMLATIRKDVPIEIKLEDAEWKKNISVKKIKELFDELEFRSLNNRMSEIFGEQREENSEKREENDGLLTSRFSLLATPDEVKETCLALWVLNSNITNPTIQDVYSYARTDDFKKAKAYILSEIKKQGLEFVYEKIEKPLIKVVEEMSINGIKIDKEVLQKLSDEYNKRLSILEKQIHKMTEHEFNINSPKQLADVLFVKMGLKYRGMRKTSSGAYSTKEEVLQKLVDVHPVANKILEYRELAKLVSTYIDAFPKLIASDGRLRTEFQQMGTTTGRMSSKEPNFQNIPIRSEYGKPIRNAFVAEKNKKLISFDYSQIELRLATILSGDETLTQIFKDGKDVHSSVASYVFGVKEEDVTKEMRRRAKVINFGILYGMGVSALQKNLKTDRKEAQDFYNNYFSKFSRLAEYLEETKKFAEKNGYTETLFGRRRYFEGINSKLPFIKAMAERMAINAPIQGTAADVLKLAMVEIDDYLKREEKSEKREVKLLMQVHDELVYECDENLVKEIAPKIKEIMEGVLKGKDDKEVPITANAYSGKNWGEMKEITNIGCLQP